VLTTLQLLTETRNLHCEIIERLDNDYLKNKCKEVVAHYDPVNFGDDKNKRSVMCLTNKTIEPDIFVTRDSNQFVLQGFMLLRWVGSHLMTEISANKMDPRNE
jgi:hypothetical protein